MIDIHSHPMHIKELVEQEPDLGKYVKSVYGVQSQPHSLESHIYQLDVAGIEQAVIMPIDCTTAYGCKLVTNEQIVWLMDKNPRFIGFASIDPRNLGATRQLEKAVKEYGLRGLKLDPSLQQFDLQNEEYAYPVYQLCAELNIPILFHSGMSWSPFGLAELSNPIKFEKIVQAFPDLKIIISQFGWPWVNEAFMLAIKYKNVFLETSILFSGTPSDSVRQVLEKQIGIENLYRSLADQIVFGSNTPRVDPKRLVWAIKDLELDSVLEKKIFHTNAQTLLAQTGGIKHEVYT